ncbi:MAG: SprT family zinc-dependent metalloprotease [Dehalococcoidales bacterium]|nr:SprT family zinc-dependent metalloprotease [Dehalococcoidales bacterium]
MASTLPIIKEGTLNLDGCVVAYRLRRSARARYLRLEIRPEYLSVVIPRGCGVQSGLDFMKARQGWILRHVAAMRQVKPRPVATEISSGDEIPYLGERLKVVTRPAGCRTGYVRLEKGGLTASLADNGQKLDSLLEQWYRAQAARVITEKVGKWSGQLKVKCNLITIRSQRTRWGSCSFHGNLSFNWKLLMAPEAVVDYVVIHELAHLKRWNHSGRFWNLVAMHCPEWRVMKTWLRTNEDALRDGLHSLT